jgi:RNA polymerase sigma-70 factor, ECF subfamily
MKAGHKERSSLMTIDEQNYLSELKKKNPKALEYIINLYSNLVFKIVMNVLGGENRESAKECANDIYLLIWNKHHLYNPEKASFKNWLLAISKYKAIDYKRSLSKQHNLELEEEILFSNSDIENGYILKEDQGKILQLLDSESKVDKEIFIRKYFFDEEINHIAERFNLSRGAVYNRLWRTRNSLIENFKHSEKMEVAK